VGEHFAVCVQPEFLREGTSVRDFFDPPKTVIGADDREAASIVASLYEGLPGPRFEVPVRVAEMAKYVDNAFHALKVGFANEIGAICKVAGVDSHEVMDVFKADTKLNISTAYLTPGSPFGGSCLPKDLRALTHYARHADVLVPILDHVIESNEQHLQRAYELVAASGQRRVGVFGLAFKAGTDDLRESPMVHLAEHLIGRGFDLLIHDPHVTSSHLLGANRAYMDAHLPHLARLLRGSIDDVLDHAEVCVVGVKTREVVEAMRRRGDRTMVALVRLPIDEQGGSYENLCW
jgi:GDP-mannose 6-dehydrogenase